MEGSTNVRLEDAGRQRAAGRAGKSAAAFSTAIEGRTNSCSSIPLLFWPTERTS